MTSTTKTSTPVRSRAQRLQALDRANEIRVYRARLKKDLKAGRRDVRKLLLSPPAEIATMKLIDLLLALPKYGRVKVNKILSRNRISPSKTVGGLSDRQRGELAGVLARNEAAYRERGDYQRQYRDDRRAAA